MRYFLVVLLALSAAAAYAQATKPRAESTPQRFQIVPTNDGAAWKLDTATGEVTHCRVLTLTSGAICMKAN